MAILHSPESEFAKEAIKWEALPTAQGPGLRPYLKREYPQVLYRAGRTATGILEIVETVTVDSSQAAAVYDGRGFTPTPDEAYHLVEAQEREIAVLAANRAFHDRRLGSAAQAEAAVAEAAASGHLAEVPVTPIRRKAGRLVKSSVAVSANK